MRILITIALFVATTVGSARQQQPRVGSIEGVVIRLGTATPVARARVNLGNLQAITDDGGRFVFKNLPAGRYRVSASHNAYMPGAYGQRGRGGIGSEIALEPGQEVKDVVLALAPRGAVAGRVYDQFGDPVGRATVMALKYSYQDGRRILISAANASTNDRGEYRLFWLAPSQYVIEAFAGGEFAPSPAGVEARLPVYYPGTTSAAAASLIDVPPGIDFNGVDLQLTETRSVRVRGQLVDGLTGKPTNIGDVTLVPRRGTVATGTLQRATLSSAGTFEFRQIAPGSYDIVATANGAARLAAHVPVEVGNRDIDNLALVLQPRFSIDGRVSFENMQAGTALPNFNDIRIELRREPYTPELLITLPPIAPDGSFTLTDVLPGDYQIRVNLKSFKGYVKAAQFGAINALNPPFRIDGHSQGRLDVLISPNAGTLDGIVVDEKQQPVFDATVVLIPDPPRRERFDLYEVTGSNSSGHIHIDNIAPGDYRIFAWDDVPAEAWQDADFMRLYEDRGKPVRISESGVENVELRLISR